MEEKREAMTDIFPRLLIIEGQQIYEKLEICPLSLLLTLQDVYYIVYYKRIQIQSISELE